MGCSAKQASLLSPSQVHFDAVTSVFILYLKHLMQRVSVSAAVCVQLCVETKEGSLSLKQNIYCIDTINTQAAR